MKLYEILKKNKYLRYINDLKILQKKVYQGTSGIGVLSKNIDTHINVFNSYAFYKKDSIGYQKIILSDGISDKIIKIKLIKNASKIIKLSDHFKSEEGLKLISCRIYNNDHAYYVPYFYSSVLSNQTNNSSVLHSSSFGNSIVKENVEYDTERLFFKDTLLKTDLLLLTLYKYKKNVLNKVKIILKKTNNETCYAFNKNFKGELCRIVLKDHVKNLDPNIPYKISILGPATCNPYVFVSSETLFHI